MNLTEMKAILGRIGETNEWEMQLIRIRNKRGQTNYSACTVTLHPSDALPTFVCSLIDSYIKGAKAQLKKYNEITDYDGTAEQTTIYSLKKDHELVAQEYENLIEAMAKPEVEADALQFKANAYVISGTINLDSETSVPVKIFSMQKPVSTLKHRFFHDGSSFTELDKPVLNLRLTIDVLFFGADIYFFNMSGENLFCMERSYKAVCAACAQDVIDSDMISDPVLFKGVSGAGANPRRFVSFSRSRFEAMKDHSVRRKVAEQFGIPLNEMGQFVTSESSAADKLVRVLCKKGMFDPFEDVPVEVSSSKNWQ